jgi:glutamine synthetase
VNKNIYEMSRRERAHHRITDLPADLNEAVSAMEKDALVRETLGEHIFNHYIAAKRAEWHQYIASVHPWEHERYLSLY